LSSSANDLRLAWCSHEAARYAVTHWHYSKSMPTPPVVHVGVWERDVYTGCVLFSRGANKNLGHAFDLAQTEVCELARVALNRGHVAPVSRVVAIAIRLLKAKERGLRLIISFADPVQSHVGGIYQAGNWIYTGTTQPGQVFIDRAGRRWHPRQCSATGQKPQYGQMRYAPKMSECEKVPTPGKHRYVMPLDDAMRRRVVTLAQPYPKRDRSRENAAAPPRAEGGGIPTRSLQ
jgi:hypothetical protein